MDITNDDVQFWGSNIPNEVKQIIESANESVCNSFDNDTQRQAYLGNYIMPFVLRYFLGQEVTESDRVFYHEGLLSRFIETPKIEVKDE